MIRVVSDNRFYHQKTSCARIDIKMNVKV